MICMICRQEVPEQATICPHCYAVPCTAPPYFLNEEQHQDWLRMQYYPQRSRWQEITALREQVAELRAQNNALREQQEAFPAQPEPAAVPAQELCEQDTCVPDETLGIVPNFAVSGSDFCAYLQDGRVRLLGSRREDYADALRWPGVRMLTAGGNFLAGLRADGNVLTTGEIGFGTEAAAWNSIRQIAANSNALLGLTADDRLLTAGEPGLTGLLQAIFDTAKQNGGRVCRVMLSDSWFGVLTERSGMYKLFSHRLDQRGTLQVNSLPQGGEPSVILTERGCVLLAQGVLRGISLPPTYSQIRWDGIAPQTVMQTDTPDSGNLQWNRLRRTELYVFTQDGTVGAVASDNTTLLRLPLPDSGDRLTDLLPLGDLLLCQLRSANSIRTAYYRFGDTEMSVLK